MIGDIAKKIRRLLGYLEGSRWKLAAGVLGLGLGALLSTWMVANLLGDGVEACLNKDTHGLFLAVGKALLWLVGLVALQATSTWLSGQAEAHMVVNLRRALMDATLAAPLEASNQSHSGQKLSYFTNDVSAAMGTLTEALAEPVRALFMGVGGLAYVLWVHPVFALVALGFGLLVYLMSLFFAGWLHRIFEEIQSLRAVHESRLKDLLDGMVTARMFGMRGRLESRMDSLSQALMKKGIDWGKASALLGGANNGLHGLGARVVLFVAGLLFFSHKLSLPALMRISEMAGGVIGIFFVSRFLVGVQQSLVGAERIFAYLDAAAAEAPGPEHAGRQTDEAIAFDHVTFGYGGSRPVLQGLTFTAGKGQVIGIIGGSGGGKSTVLRLIQGLYRPLAGEVAVLGVPVKSWDLQALRSRIAYVPQEPALFPGTIEQNLTIGLAGVSHERVEQAARRAGAHDFIMAMPQGYQTTVSERGGSLSGGQRQRIAFARALLQQAPILLLDEATSAMDSAAEEGINRLIEELKGEKTILLVTHRRALLRNADAILTVEEGGASFSMV